MSVKSGLLTKPRTAAKSEWFTTKLAGGGTVRIVESAGLFSRDDGSAPSEGIPRKSQSRETSQVSDIRASIGASGTRPCKQTASKCGAILSRCAKAASVSAPIRERILVEIDTASRCCFISVAAPRAWDTVVYDLT